MPFVFVPNPPGIKEALSGPDMAALLTQVAQAAKSAAHARGLDRAGDIVAEGATERNGTLSSRLGSTSSFWHLEEFGSVNNPPYRTLTTAVLTLGLRFEAGTGP